MDFPGIGTPQEEFSADEDDALLTEETSSSEGDHAAEEDFPAAEDTHSTAGVVRRPVINEDDDEEGDNKENAESMQISEEQIAELNQLEFEVDGAPEVVDPDPLSSGMDVERADLRSSHQNFSEESDMEHRSSPEARTAEPEMTAPPDAKRKRVRLRSVEECESSSRESAKGSGVQRNKRAFDVVSATDPLPAAQAAVQSEAPSPAGLDAVADGDLDLLNENQAATEVMDVSNEEDHPVVALPAEPAGAVEESESDDEPLVTSEAREERLLQRYTKCLGLLRVIPFLTTENAFEEPAIREKLTSLSERFARILDEIPDFEGSVTDSRMKALRFAVLKNLANIVQRQREFEKALDYLMAAAELDYTDIVMMYDMGRLAVKLDNFPLAASFFQDAVRLRPNHWPSLDAMITLMYSLNFLPACLEYCYMALRLEPSYARALTFVHELLKDDAFFRHEWLASFKKISPCAGKPLKKGFQRFLDESVDIKNRWWKPGSNGGDDPNMQLKTARMPVLQNWTYLGLGEMLLSFYAHLDANRLWNAIIQVDTEHLSRDAVMQNPSYERSFSSITVESSSVSVDDASRLTEVSQPTAPAPRAKQRKLDPIFIEFADKRRSGRTKVNSRNEEAQIRGFLQRAVRDVFGDITLDRQPETHSDGARTATEAESSLWANVSEEVDEIKRQLEKANNTRIGGTIRRYLQFLAEHAGVKWPAGCGRVFLELYNIIAHEEYFPPYQDYDERMEITTRKVILFALCGLELQVDHWMQFGAIDELSRNFTTLLDYVAVWPHAGELVSDSDVPMHLRILFLMQKWHTLHINHEQSQAFAGEIKKRIKYGVRVELPNLKKQNVLDEDVVVRLVSGKEQSGILSDLETALQENRKEQALKTAKELMAQWKTADMADGVTFLPFHVKSVLSTSVELEAWGDFFDLAIYFMTALHKQLGRIADDKDEELRGSLRSLSTDICDQIVQQIQSGSSAISSWFMLSLNSLGDWIPTVADICVFSVHSLAGNVRRPATISPFVLFYHILRAACLVNNLPKKRSGDGVVHYIEEAHCYLGEHGWCTMSEGAFLHSAVDRLSDELDSRTEENKNSTIPTADIEFDIEQCFYCLYGLTKTKNRYLQKHNVAPVELTLSRAVPLYKYYEPLELPEWDGYRTDCISQETVDALTKIRNVVGDIPYVISRKELDSFIRQFDSVTERPEIPTGKAAPGEVDSPKAVICRNLFYLLADYYFKSGDNARALKLYKSDLCINLDRVDSWAGLAMNKGAVVEQKLRSFDLKPEQKLLEEAMETVACFGIAAKIDSSTEHLWIEYLNQVYPLHSYLSRQLVQSAQFQLTRAQKADLRLHRTHLLHLSQKVCLRAEDCEERRETWLGQYMLGKTYEKLERSRPWKYLSQYTAAAQALHCAKACYPGKVSYYKMPRLAVEALEMYYRVMSSSLKYLCGRYRCELGEERSLQAVEFYLGLAERSPFAACKELSRRHPGNQTEPELYVAQRVLTSSALEPLEFEELPKKPMEEWRAELVARCIKGLHLCLGRYPEHYKSLYRLARLYYEYGPVKDLQKTKDLLLGPTLSWQEKPYMPSPGLFQARKPNAFFRGVWHIKSEEIQRSLSFPSHMYRSILLLINVLADLRENLLLLQVYQQLAKPPEQAIKRFLRLDDYHHLSELAMKKALLSILNRVEDYETESCSEDVQIAFLGEVLKVWQSARKENLSSRNVNLANSMLANAYLRLVDGIDKTLCPVSIPADVVDKAVLYIQQLQLRVPKSPVKSRTTINLSTGLPEQPDEAPSVGGSTAPGSVDSGAAAEPSGGNPPAEEMDDQDLDAALDFGLTSGNAGLGNVNFDDDMADLETDENL